MKSMRKAVNSLVVATSILASSAAIAEVESNFKSYVGTDVQIRHMDFQKGFGQNLFKHDITQGNIFFGISLTENFRIEAGYEANPSKTKTELIQVGDVASGVSIEYPTQFSSTARIHGPHISLAAATPLNDGKFNLVGMVGVAHLKLNLRRRSNFITVGGVNVDPLDVDVENITTYSKTKNILKLSLGLEYEISKNWGFRTLLGWENTKKFNMLAIEPNRTDRVKPHNSMLYSMGVFTKF
jgi:opacity protein-like surface antigen